MGSKISIQIERALLGKSSDVGISALDIDSGRINGLPGSNASIQALQSRT